MNIVQKLKIDGELTSNLQVIVRDETGLYSTTNLGGYGGANGSPVNKFQKYIFDLYNLYTNSNYRQIQSNDPTNLNEHFTPPVGAIANKDNVTIDADNFSLLKFPDGLYRLTMAVQLVDYFLGNGYIGTDVITNVPGAVAIFNDYNGIIVNGEIYKFNAIVQNTIVLDRAIVASFTSFKPVVITTNDFIISDNLNDCIDSTIANLSKDCDPTSMINTLNLMSEVQLYYWGMKRSIDKNDLDQAYQYFQMAKSLCDSNNCNCHG